MRLPEALKPLPSPAPPRHQAVALMHGCCEMLKARWAEITTPFYLVHGVEDTIVKPDTYERCGTIVLFYCGV